MAASYYRIIEGKRYDRALLERVEALTQGRGDGRISQSDAQELWSLVQDGRGITPTERATLEYAQIAYQWTDAAVEWLHHRINDQESDLLTSLQKIIRQTFGLSFLNFVARDQDLSAQMAINNQVISVDQALYAALHSLLHEQLGGESPKSIVQEVHQLFPENTEQWESELQARVHQYFEQGTLTLLPIDPEDSDEEFPVNPPEEGESVEENWVFELSLPTLSDHIYWAIVPRNGSQAYHYGFN